MNDNNNEQFATSRAVREYYLRREAENVKQLKSQQSRWTVLGYFRGALFLLMLAPLLAGFMNAGGYGSLWWWLFGAAVVVFLVFAAVHENLANSVRLCRLLLRVDRASLARLDRRLAEIAEAVPEPPTSAAATCRDLDLFGSHSLYKLLGTVRTPAGVELLANWIVDGSDTVTIKKRQDAIAALKPLGDWRHRFQLIAEQLASSPTGPRDFVQWCQRPSWLESRAWILWLSRAAVCVLVAAIVLMIGGLLQLPVGVPIAISAILVNFFLSVFFAGPVHDVFNQVSSRYDETAKYQSLFQMLQSCTATSSRLDELRAQMFTNDSILGAMTRLQRLVWLANLRRNGILFLGYLILQLTTFWDVHVLDRLEKWRLRYGIHAQDWFLALGEWEVMNALAKFAADHPDWTFPMVVPKAVGGMLLDATGLGHPLLSNDARVDNDVNLGPDGTFLLVTGSNMSGKSTLLRSIGLNATLAQMGSVVCARSMQVPVVSIDTSMRISDSLADGVSFFMAELKRLKAIVDRSKSLHVDTQRGHLFLLDEILQGTNSRERQIAVAEVLKQLVDQGSIGAISTHDLELGGVESLSLICQAVHFNESFEIRDGAEVMTFDYKMKQGVAPTTNALKLLELVGLREKQSRA